MAYFLIVSQKNVEPLKLLIVLYKSCVVITTVLIITQLLFMYLQLINVNILHTPFIYSLLLKTSSHCYENNDKYGNKNNNNMELLCHVRQQHNYK